MNKQHHALSQSQMGIYLECLDKEDLCYTLPYLYVFDKSLDPVRLCRAVETAIKAHPTLFTRITTDEAGTPVQYIEEEKLTITVESLNGRDFHSLVKPFTLLGGRLFHVNVLQDEQHTYLFWECHHIIYDGSSLQVLLHHIETAYNGEPISQEQLTITEVAEQENALRATEAYEEGKQWYAANFDCEDTANSLIADKEKDKDNNEISIIERRLNIDLKQMETFCHANGIYKSTLMTTAYAYLLARYNNEQAALTRTVYNGRGDKRLADSIGMFVRTVPVYCSFDDDTTVLQLLNRQQEQMSGCMNHEAYSYIDMVNDLHIQPDNTFAWHGKLFTNRQLMGSAMKIHQIRPDKEDDRLYFKSYISDGCVWLHAEFDNDYSKQFITDVIESYENVVNGMLSKELLRDICMTSDKQQEKLNSFNDNAMPIDETETVVSVFRDMVTHQPDKTAVVFKDKHYTYREADDISNRLAAYINENNQKTHLTPQCDRGSTKRPNDQSPKQPNENVVAILVPRSEWMLIASLGVLKAGCAYLPLDPTYPKERLAFMMQDAGVRLVIADDSLTHLIDGYDGEVLLTSAIVSLSTSLSSERSNACLSNDSQLSARHAVTLASARTFNPQPSTLFTLLYTSGSTGVPKGVMLEHRNVMAFCRMHQHVTHIDNDSRVGAYASYGFDACLLELWAPLIVGATIYVIPEEMRLDLITLNKYFEENHITHTFMTTQVARQFVNDIDNHSLKTFITGGEKLADVTPPPYLLINGYGPTESICYVTAFEVRESMQNIPIGKAVPNMNLYIMDRYGHRQPVGAVGELWVNGPQVSRGYLNHPEKTAEAFVNSECIIHNSKSSMCGMRFYRTGDIVRYLPDGNIQFVGRRDGQVKIRGFRIELKEVEGIIRQYPGIKDVTVQAFDQEDGGKYIAAYVVSDERVDIQALNDFIQEEKPPYMVPAATMQIDSIPLNQNQKVDKRRLPKPVLTADSRATEDDSRPLNMLEEELKQMVAEIIHNNDFGVTTILGYAGLTSILAIKLAVQVNKRFNVTLNSKTLVKSGTLQSIENEILSVLLNEKKRPNPPCEGGSVKQLNDQSPKQITFPLSYAQAGVYVECIKQPQSTIYNIPTKIAFPKGTDTTKLAEAAKTLVKTHPQLTVSFSIQEGEVIQTMHPDQAAIVPVATMSEAELEIYKQKFVKPFELSKGPLCRMEVVETEARAYLLMDVHHLVADGASIDIMLRQLCDMMNGLSIEHESLNYAQYVSKQKAEENGTAYVAAKDFFQQQLAECEEATEVPADLTNPVAQGETKTVSSPLDMERVEKFCRQNNITPAHLTLAAVYYTLARFTNNERITLTTISNGRADINTADTVGMFVNTLALSIKIGNQSVKEFLTSVSRQFDSTLEHENYPFAQIAADYDLVAEIMFAYQIGVLNRYIVGGEQLEIENMELNVPKFRIAFYIQEFDGQPSVTIDYDNGRYSEALMKSIATSVTVAVEAFINNPAERLPHVSLLSAEQERLLDSFNETEVPYDNTQTIVSLFRKQVEAHPDNIAVVYHDCKYTYKQVDELSNCIASYINENRNENKNDKSPKQPEENVVSILIPRSEWMVIASLGVLKAGCAYQPLDPSYPAERLNFMMRDANAMLLITNEDLRPLVSDYTGDTLMISDIMRMPLTHKPSTLNFQPSARHAVTLASARTFDPQPSTLFVLLYTSGSTGTPKGVMLEHRNLVAFCHWYQRYYELTPDCRVAAYASYGFDASMMDMYPALTCGASVYIIGDDIRLNLPELNDYFNSKGITHSFITTQVGYQFATNMHNSSLRHFSVGGEKLSALQPPKGYIMHNCYGPTECTIFTTTYKLEQYNQDIPIGKPVDNLKLYIVDKDQNRLPAGAMGELWVNGPQVGRGYLNLPEKTAEAFVNSECIIHNSKSSMCGMRFYRTGDIVRYLPDGNIQFVGRRDSQVKIRGFRIELKEVEAVVREYPGIKDATVQAFDYDNGGKYIAAYVVSDEQVDVVALNAFVASRKPPYMVPAATMQIDSIPLNQNQKVNRKALPEPVISMTDSEYVEPANEREKLFCKIFGNILDIEQYSATANFFELGGTSVMVIRVITEADKAGHHIAYGDVFDNPTPRQLAALLQSHPAPPCEGGSPKRPNDQISKQPNADAQYDYKPIDVVLMRNTLYNFRIGKRQAIGNALLTGATGYLGIHVLKELIDRSDVPAIYCLVRADDKEQGERRLKRLLFYYFGNNFKELFGSRLHVITGDVTEEFWNKGDKNKDMGFINTVFNCAAVVKHFSAGTEIEDVNIGGAVNCVRFCVETGARLIHISTYSTAGLSIDGTPTPDTVQTEQTLYYGQHMENRYVHSKFVAERTVLEAIAIHGLNAKVMRVGNLAPRSTDGEFQINAQTNSAMGRVRVFRTLGCYPYEMTDQPMEFSPINEVAHAVVLLSETPRECCLFHPFNNHSVHFGDVLAELYLTGIAPQQVEATEYEKALQLAKSNPDKAQQLQSLLAYQDISNGQNTIMLSTANSYTTQVLYRMGFRWSSTSWDYVDRFITALDGLDFFNQ